MEGLLPRTAFAEYVGDKLGEQRFTLLDIGCGGGIDEAWRCFGSKLRAICIDPNVAEINRLSSTESNVGVEYVAGFVGVPDDHPLAKPARDHGFWGRNPWNRFSADRSLELQQAAIGRMSDTDKVKINAWNQAKLADGPQIHLPDLLNARNLCDVDFVKIDVDGPDYLIIQSLADTLTQAGILGVGIEVNFYGSDHPLDNTFHNVDRFMRSKGFDLFGLSTRTYSMRALPAPFVLNMAAQTTFGRPFQGDALYLRDLASTDFAEVAKGLSNEKLVKLAAICSLTSLPDCAADILVTYRDRLASYLDIERALDLLVQQTDLGRQRGLNYRDYMAVFQQDAGSFYPKNLARQISEPLSVAPSSRPASVWKKKLRRIKKAIKRVIAAGKST
jgi:hypothetical protein